MPVTLNGGYPMPSWFDLISLDVNSKEDEEGIKRAAHKVHGKYFFFFFFLRQEGWRSF